MNNVETYRQMTDLHSRLPVFYQPWWLDTVCKKWDIVLFKKQEKIVAIWPFQVERKAWLRLIRTPLLTPYLQPISLTGNKEKEPSVSKDDYAALLKLLPSHAFLQFITLPEQSETGFFLDNNEVTVTRRITYYITLKVEEHTLFSNIHEKRKNDIRKADKDLIVEETELPVNLFFELHKDTFERKGQRYPYSEKFIRDIAEAATANNAALCFVAKDNAENVAALLWAVHDQNTMYYLLSATSITHKHRGAISLLIWKAMCRAKKSGLEIFDFEGSSDPGIEQFFKKFGGEKKHFYSISHTPSTLWRMKQRYLK